ncbi:MAG: BTAD domain-containing putative transcriptional regulator [Acidimicrobiales bacterium]
MNTDRLQFHVLGPLEVTSQGHPIDLGPHKQRSLLALLVANVNHVVSIDRIAEALWGDDAEGRENTIFVYISRLRSVLEPERPKRAESTVLVTREPGYMLRSDPRDVDALRFTECLAAARLHLDSDPTQALESLDSALSEWRGEAFADFAYEAFARDEIVRLEEELLEATELRFEGQLRLGQPGGIVTDLESHVRQNPLREQPVGQLMIALYRTGRQADALRAFERHRRIVGEELGIQPSPHLAQLEEQILLHDDRLRPVDDRGAGVGFTDDQANPYVGLRAFAESDQAGFHGRDRLVAGVLRRLSSADPLVALVGPSGSGKSSIVQAGVIPQIRKGALGAPEDWLVARMVPGAHPFAELEAALLRSRLDAPDSLADQLDAGDQSILRACLRVLHEDTARLLLVIDQFEELFTLTDDVDERRRFLDALLLAIDDPHGRIKVLLTLRADMYSRPLAHARFGGRLGDAVLNVTPLDASELEEAALRPAAFAGVRIETRVLGRLIADVVDQPGALPMFQYALTELYERREADLMVERAYDEMGGVRGAITNRAEQLYLDIGPEEQAAARQLFLRLVSVTDGDAWHRRRVKAAEIISLDVDIVALQAVLDTFGAHRLLLFDQDRAHGSPTVEVGHEALLTEWDRLDGWIREARVDLERHAAFLSALGEWERSGHDDGYLITGTRVAEYERWASSPAFELNTRELDFLGASLEKRQAEVQADEERVLREVALAGRARRRLWGMAAAGSALVAAAAMALLFVLFSSDPPRVALIHLTDNLLDVGLSEAERRFDIDAVRVTPPWVSVEDAQRNLAESGTDLVFMTGDLDHGITPYTAADYPDTTFVVAYDPTESIAPNHVRYNFADEQIGYLAGVAAAHTTSTGHIGYIAAVGRTAETEATQAGFEQGARSVLPEIDISVRALVDVNQIPSGYNPWGDPDLGHEVAAELYTTSVDVIFHEADGSGLGVFSAARESSLETGIQRWGIGNGSDQHFSVLSPGDADHVLMSVISRLDTVVLDATERWLAGELAGGNHVLTIATDGIDYVDSGGKLAEDTIEALDRAMAAVGAGDITISRFPERAVSTDQTPLDESDDRFDLAAGGNRLTALGLFDIVRFQDDDREVVGFGVDLIDEIAERLGLNVDHQDAEFQNMLTQIAEGSADIAVCFCDITPERQERFAFTDPILRNRRALLVSTSSPVNGIDDAMKVVVAPGSSHEDFLRVEYPDIERISIGGFDGVAIVERGEADAMLVDQWWAEQWVPVTDGALAVVATPFETAVGFPIHAERTELAAAVNDTITEMMADGTFDEIHDRWFGADAPRVLP